MTPSNSTPPSTSDAPSLVVEPQPPELPDSPVIITGYQITDGTVDFVQLYNKSSSLLPLDGWQLALTRSTETADVVTPIALSGNLLSHGYIVVSRHGAVANSDSEFPAIVTTPASELTDMTLSLPDVYAADSVKELLSSDNWLSLSQTSAGNYTTTSKFLPATAQTPLYGGGFYTYPETTPLRVVELLTNPRNCSPLDMSDDCFTYVKLFNASPQSVALHAYRLRFGYSNQAPGIGNAVALDGSLAPGSYLAIRARDDGNPLAMVSSGGNVWLEDTYGLKTYDESVVSYQDLGTLAHEGQAWAYDGSDATAPWKWATATIDGPNDFSLPKLVEKTGSMTPLAPCQEGQYRSAETNRCRAAASATTALVPCHTGQYRSTETNRCRSLATLTAALVPCAVNQERNPLTNRCRSSASVSLASLKPCADNQERNPTTNRCRSVTSSTIPAAAFAVEPIADTGMAFTGWWALGGITFLGVGYGAWEWRREGWQGIQKVRQFFASRK